MLLAADAGISQATAYRYLHEGIDVLAGEAPDLPEVLERCRHQHLPCIILDGTLIRCDRLTGETERGTDLWYAIWIKHFAGNVQFLAAPDWWQRHTTASGVGQRHAEDAKLAAGPRFCRVR